MLIGEPGVGKTAIVEGLAQRIVNEEVPESLKGKRLLVLDLASLIAGAKFRGEFENVERVLNDFPKTMAKPNIFIDDPHFGGRRQSRRAMDAAYVETCRLARGELHCIGRNHLDEYRQYIEKDALLSAVSKKYGERASVESTIAILRGLKSVRNHHK